MYEIILSTLGSRYRYSYGYIELARAASLLVQCTDKRVCMDKFCIDGESTKEGSLLVLYR